MQQHALVALADLERVADSCVLQPSTSRMRITARCAGGSAVIVATITSSASRWWRVSSGSRSQFAGKTFQPPG